MKALLSVGQTAELLSIGKSRCWEAIRSGEIRTVRIGRRVLVPTTEIARLSGLQLEEVLLLLGHRPTADDVLEGDQ